MWESLRKDRGQPWDHDPGPDPDGGWAELFAATPHYRRISAELLGDEAFRWHFGPMFYRGRLGDGQAKVCVVGQEGAQDESLAHRSFVGGTGARLQHLLRHLGVRRSYLFLNTFVPASSAAPRSPPRAAPRPRPRCCATRTPTSTWPTAAAAGTW